MELEGRKAADKSAADKKTAAEKAAEAKVDEAQRLRRTNVHHTVTFWPCIHTAPFSPCGSVVPFSPCCSVVRCHLCDFVYCEFWILELPFFSEVLRRRKKKQAIKQMQPSLGTTSLSSCKCNETATKACDRTRVELDTLLKDARVEGVTRRDTDAYRDYFKSVTCPGGDTPMDHCKKCSKTIDMHHCRQVTEALRTVCLQGTLKNWRQFFQARFQLYVLAETYGARGTPNGISVPADRGQDVDIELYFDGSGLMGGFIRDVRIMAEIRKVNHCVDFTPTDAPCPANAKLVLPKDYTALSDSPESSLRTSTPISSKQEQSEKQELYEFQRVEELSLFAVQKLHIVPDALVGSKHKPWVYILAGPIFQTYFDGGCDDIPVIRFAIEGSPQASQGRVIVSVRFDCTRVPEIDSASIIPVPTARREGNCFIVPLSISENGLMFFMEAITWRNACILEAEKRVKSGEKLSLNNIPAGQAWYTSKELPDCLQQFKKKTPVKRSPGKKAKKTKKDKGEQDDT